MKCLMVCVAIVLCASVASACPQVAVANVQAFAACPQVAVQSFAVVQQPVAVQSFAVQSLAVQPVAVQSFGVQALAVPVQAVGCNGAQAQRQGILSRILGGRRLLPKAKSVSVVR